MADETAFGGRRPRRRMLDAALAKTFRERGGELLESRRTSAERPSEGIVCANLIADISDATKDQIDTGD